MNADVAVIGGGVSGLAAAVELALSGKKVLLLEQSQKLGGRCYSFRDETTGDEVDNGQHVLIGAYHHALRYLTRVGTRKFLATQKSIPLHHPISGFSSVTFGTAPAPLHLLTAVLRYSHLSITDRLNVLKVGFFLRNWTDGTTRSLTGMTVDVWLTSLGQSKSVKESLWNPLAISIMNELPEQASALLFAHSLRSAFFGSQEDISVMIPTIGQTALYVDGARRILEQNGCIIRTGSEVIKILSDNQYVTGIRVADGSEVKAEYIISAVPHYALAKILPDASRNSIPFAKFNSSPIVSVHLWFETDFMPMNYCGLIGKKLQWVFNKRKIEGKIHTETAYLSAVISGAYDVVDKTKDELVDLAVREIGEIFPESKTSRLLHSYVIKEKRATFSSTPENERFRPAAETVFKNFFLAGDWTKTGLPATIEGAIQSGFHAAGLIKERG
jgi:squalene-associated FAD-dependent desaturase